MDVYHSTHHTYTNGLFYGVSHFSPGVEAKDDGGNPITVSCVWHTEDICMNSLICTIYKQSGVISSEWVTASGIGSIFLMWR